MTSKPVEGILSGCHCHEMCSNKSTQWVTCVVEHDSTVQLLTWCRVVIEIEEVVPTLEYILEPTYSTQM